MELPGLPITRWDERFNPEQALGVTGVTGVFGYEAAAVSGHLSGDSDRRSG